MITAEELRLLMSYDPETGLFKWRVSRSSNARAGDVAGCVAKQHDGREYRRIRVRGHLHRAHRLAWLYAYGEWPNEEIDHINGDGLDNRLSNLRIATSSQNSCNTRLKSDNTSGIKGVFPHGEKWRARIKVGGRLLCLGIFTDKEDAAEAYRQAAIKHFGEFANPARSNPYLPDRRTPSGSNAAGVDCPSAPAATFQENE
jgi:hypothetical protein